LRGGDPLWTADVERHCWTKSVPQRNSVGACVRLTRRYRVTVLTTSKPDQFSNKFQVVTPSLPSVLNATSRPQLAM
jgi:hypothetical protein